jgi:hypothetical protein
VKANYSYNQAIDGGGNMVFNFPGDAGADITLRSRWQKTGAGRADARLTGGDLGAQIVTASECWDTAFGRVYYQDSATYKPTEGLATSCVFTDQDLPPAK